MLRTGLDADRHGAHVYRPRARALDLRADSARQAGRRLLGTEAGAAYVAVSMRRRLTDTGHTVHGLLDMGTAPVSAIMGAAEFCSPEDPLREAARRLGRDGVSALARPARGRRRWGSSPTPACAPRSLADGVPLDGPVRAALRSPTPTVPADQLAIEATVEMLAVGSEHLAVLDGDRICGVLSATDLLSLDARSPIALRHVLLGAPRRGRAGRAPPDRYPSCSSCWRGPACPPRELGRVLSLQHDTVVARLIDFSMAARGQAPVPWSWIDLGSAARREFTLASDQDNALAYADVEPAAAAEVDAYFERMGADVNDGLVRCGIGVDNNGVLARNRQWRMSKTDWLKTFDDVLSEPDESHLIRATVSFDFRLERGRADDRARADRTVRAARGYPQFMRLMARTATGYPVALGFRGQLATGHDGDPPGQARPQARRDHPAWSTWSASTRWPAE